jgi:hypothetical protein
MTKIKCKTKIKEDSKKLRVKIIKAPLVNTEQLKQIIFFRSRAVVL